MTTSMTFYGTMVGRFHGPDSTLFPHNFQKPIEMDTVLS